MKATGGYTDLRCEIMISAVQIQLQRIIGHTIYAFNHLPNSLPLLWTRRETLYIISTRSVARESTRGPTYAWVGSRTALVSPLQLRHTQSNVPNRHIKDTRTRTFSGHSCRVKQQELLLRALAAHEPSALHRKVRPCALQLANGVISLAEIIHVRKGRRADAPSLYTDLSPLY